MREPIPSYNDHGRVFLENPICQGFILPTRKMLRTVENYYDRIYATAKIVN